jgi:hypothetical protein
MLGLTIAVSMRVIGALLVDAFILLPAIGAVLISRSLKQIFFLSSLFGLVSGMIGLYLSFLLDIPTSSAVIIVASFIIAVCFLIQRRSAMQGLKKIFSRRRMSFLMFLIGWIGFLNLPLSASAQEAVVASTSLAGAIAKAAGAKEVRVMVSTEMRHPPEYDLKPSDLMKFEGAKVIIYGGYERMVSKLLETSQNKNILAIQINTDTSPENLISQARKISEILKTEKEEKAWEERFIGRLKELQKKISPYSGKRAVVHKFAQPFAQWAGLQVVQTVTPGELTPKVIGDSVAKHPDLVVDIYHLPVAQVIAENAKCKYIQVINFPGVGNTESLDDLFEYNAMQLIQTK